MENFDWQPIFDFLLPLAPWVQYVFMALGAVVVLATLADTLIPDEKDKGFMKKVYEVPVLGTFLKALTRFSPFNVKDK